MGEAWGGRYEDKTDKQCRRKGWWEMTGKQQEMKVERVENESSKSSLKKCENGKEQEKRRAKSRKRKGIQEVRHKN